MTRIDEGRQAFDDGLPYDPGQSKAWQAGYTQRQAAAQSEAQGQDRRRGRPQVAPAPANDADRTQAWRQELTRTLKWATAGIWVLATLALLATFAAILALINLILSQ